MKNTWSNRFSSSSKYVMPVKTDSVALSTLNVALKPLSLALSASKIGTLLIPSLLAPSVFAAVIIDVAVTNVSSSSGAAVLQAGVMEGDTLTVFVSSNVAEREQMGNAKCTVSGRLGLAAGSTADGSDISFVNGGVFSYDVNFSDTANQVGEARVQAVVTRDAQLDEQEEFSVIVQEGSAKVSCTGIDGELIDKVSSSGWGQIIASNGDYAYELYKVKLVDGAAPEPVPPPATNPDPNVNVPVIPPAEADSFDLRKLDVILQQVQAVTDIALFNVHSKTRSIARELARRRQGEGGFSSDNFSFKLNGHSFALGQYLSRASDGNQAGNTGRWGGFLSGSIDVGETENGAATEIEFGSSLITAGVDLQMQHWVVGMAVSIVSSDADVATVKNAVELSQNGLSVFASYYQDMFYADFILSSSRSSYDFTGKQTSASTSYANTEGNEMGFAFSTGIEGNIGKTDYSFFLLYDYLNMSLDSFSEFNNVTVDSFDRASQQLELGSRISYTVNSSIGVFLPFAVLSYRDDLEDKPTTLTYSQDAKRLAQANFNAIDQDAYLSAQLGVSAVFPHGVSVFASYENDLTSERWNRQRYDIGLRWEY